MSIELTAPIVLVGAGRMGGALLAGWLEKGADPGFVYVQDPAPSPETLALAEKFDVTVAAELTMDVPPQAVVLAVKPQVMGKVLQGLAPGVPETCVVLSIAAGKTIEYFSSYLGDRAAIVRSMPNTPASIGCGISALIANKNSTAEQRALCETLLGAAGEVVWLTDEAQMDAVTAVSGSGPAYVFYLTECLTEAGIRAGLDFDLAAKLAKATVWGAGELQRQTGQSPAKLRENVTSPGGTTEAALNILMQKNGLKPLLIDAVKAAVKRARELSSLGMKLKKDDTQ